MIRQILSAPKSIHAYFKGIKVNKLNIQVGSIESLPVEILSIKIGSQTIKPAENVILPSKQHNEFIRYKNIVFNLSPNVSWNDSMSRNLQINYAIPGGENVQKALVFSYPHVGAEYIIDDVKSRTGNMEEFSFLQVDQASHSVIFKPGKNIINKDLMIPKGYKVIAGSGVELDMKNKAKLVSYSPVSFIGSEERDILITSSDSSSQGIELIQALPSTFQNVMFTNMAAVKDPQWTRTGAITCYESSVSFKRCSFYNFKSEDAVNVLRSEFVFSECLFRNMKNDGLDIDFSKGSLDHCAFELNNENALDITMGNVKFNSVYIYDSGNKALNLKVGSQFNGSDLRIKKAHIGICAEDESSADLKKITISDSEFGIVAFKNSKNAGHPILTFNSLQLENIKTKYLKEKKASLIINGSEVNESNENVETIIKSDKKAKK
jgi:hypothetical protein